MKVEVGVRGFTSVSIASALSEGHFRIDLTSLLRKTYPLLSTTAASARLSRPRFNSLLLRFRRRTQALCNSSPCYRLRFRKGSSAQSFRCPHIVHQHRSRRC